jgi:TolB-like protein/DNA-binding winged helix-turn-helix (wHTH) protein/cytochrome c-type biogenesis protein CcmH/NrfG
MHPDIAAAKAESTVIYAVDDLIVDTAMVRVTRAGVEIPLPRLSYDFLLALCTAAPRVLSTDELMHTVWPGLIVSPETINQRAKLTRDALGDDSRTPRYLASVRGRGYRMVAQVRKLDRPAGDDLSASGSPAVSGKHPRRRFAVALVLAAGILGAAWWAWQQRVNVVPPTSQRQNPAPAVSLPARSVAVLPFDDMSPQQDSAFIAQGMAESLLHQMASLRDIDVISRTSSFAFDGKKRDVRDIGRQLNARYLLEGSVQHDKQQLRVTAQLIDAETGMHVWSMRFDRSPDDIFAVQDEIALEVTKALQLSLDSNASARLTHRGTDNVDAYLSFLRGVALLGNSRVSDMASAVENLSSAVKQDPRFSSALALLASAKLTTAEYQGRRNRDEQFLDALDEARLMADRAVQLDPDNGFAYIERGYVNAFVDLAQAQADYQRGLKLNPNSARGHAGLAAVLFRDRLRGDDALAALDRARRLDPLEPSYDVTRAVFLAYARSDITAADALLTQVVQRNPLYVPALSRLGELKWCCEGQLAESAKLLEQVLKLDAQADQPRRLLAHAYLSMDEFAAARQVLDGAPVPLAERNISLLLLRGKWPQAAAAAYAGYKDGNISPAGELEALLAIRIDAHHGNVLKARRLLETVSGVTFDAADQPRLPREPRLLDVYVGFAEVLMMQGEIARSERLLRLVLAEIRADATRIGRPNQWNYLPQGAASSLLKDHETALSSVEQAMASGIGIQHHLFYSLDPRLDPIRKHPRFIAALQKCTAHRLAQRLRLVELRRLGEVPVR